MRPIKIFIFILLMNISGFAAFDFSSIIYDYSGIPDLSYYRARDNYHLPYRYYPSSSNKLIIILHGSAYHSRYFYHLSKELSKQGVAQIVSPDLRGHGNNPARRGDVDYIGQLDDDLDDLVQFCLNKYQAKKIIMAGHSSGGGLALRLAGDHKRVQADAYLLLAPYFAHDAPTINPASGWAKPHLFKVILANILNGIGLHWLDHATTVSFNMPEQYRDGSETLSYSHALISSYTPLDHRADLANISKKTLIIVGEHDEAMLAHAYQETLPVNENIEFEILPHVTHIGIVTDDSAITAMAQWLGSL